MRARAAYRNDALSVHDSNYIKRARREEKRKDGIDEGHVSPNESGEREAQRTVPDSDMGRAQGELIGLRRATHSRTAVHTQLS